MNLNGLHLCSDQNQTHRKSDRDTWPRLKTVEIHTKNVISLYMFLCGSYQAALGFCTRSFKNSPGYVFRFMVDKLVAVL